MADIRDGLAVRLHNARARADQYVDLRAAEIAKDNPGIPVGVSADNIRKRDCACSYALSLLDEESKVATDVNG